MALFDGGVVAVFRAVPRFCELFFEVFELLYMLGQVFKIVFAAVDFFVDYYFVEPLLAVEELFGDVYLEFVCQRDREQQADGLVLGGLYALGD